MANFETAGPSPRRTAQAKKSAAFASTAVALAGTLLTTLASSTSWAIDAQQDDILHIPHNSVLFNESSDWTPKKGVLLAQADGDDAYDPFADYSEFEESMDEEEDINFFRNGRLLTIGFIGGWRSWTGVLNQIYSSNPTFGVFLSYFFDLRFALQFGYLTSNHVLLIPTNGTFDTVQGNINITDLSVTLKYYFNTQNVTRGLADLNPYVIGGFSQIYRTANVTGNSQFAKDSAFGFDIGAGLELPMMHNKMFFGAQVMFQLVNFPDDGTMYLDDLGRPTGVSPNGDTWNALAILGVNF
jgi:opacity protein-like surface antigen